MDTVSCSLHSAPAALYKVVSLLSGKTWRAAQVSGHTYTHTHTHLIWERKLVENVGVKQASVKVLLSLRSSLNLPELAVMFGLERIFTLQRRDDLKTKTTQAGLLVWDLTQIHT